MTANDRTTRTAATQLELLGRVKSYARLLDSSVRVPVVGYRVGLDGLIGLIPGIGDLAGAALSGYVIWLAHQAGAPSHLKMRMAGNVALETVIGAIPILGDLLDFAFKANLRNARLLERYLSRASGTGSRPPSQSG